jgi:hypothetical protein
MEQNDQINENVLYVGGFDDRWKFKLSGGNTRLEGSVRYCPFAAGHT